MGQRSRLVTADRCTHALVDYREVDRTKLLTRVHAVHSPGAHLTAQRVHICSGVLGHYRPLNFAVRKPRCIWTDDYAASACDETAKRCHSPTPLRV
jgi:hypothetical protein